MVSKKMIIAEDNELSRKILIGFIKDFFEVEIDSVYDGTELVDKVKSGNYDLVFTDHQMFLMNGIEAIMKIREFNKEVPIYMYSASDKEREALEAGASGYIKKSAYPDKLEEVLSKYLIKNGS